MLPVQSFAPFCQTEYAGKVLQRIQSSVPPVSQLPCPISMKNTVSSYQQTVTKYAKNKEYIIDLHIEYVWPGFSP